jgi:hypothetical protein
MANVIRKHAQNNKLYNFRGAKLGDGAGNQATFESEAERDLFTTSEMTLSVESLMGKRDPDGLVVTWLTQTSGSPSKELRTPLGVNQGERMRTFVGGASNEIIISAHCTAEDLDYITGQLRSFSK